jgi:hypothetical protein
VPISLVPALALLCFYVSTFRSMCAVPNMAVINIVIKSTGHTQVNGTYKPQRPCLEMKRLWT